MFLPFLTYSIKFFTAESLYFSETRTKCSCITCLGFPSVILIVIVLFVDDISLNVSSGILGGIYNIALLNWLGIFPLLFAEIPISSVVHQFIAKSEVEIWKINTKFGVQFYWNVFTSYQIAVVKFVVIGGIYIVIKYWIEKINLKLFKFSIRFIGMNPINS